MTETSPVHIFAPRCENIRVVLRVKSLLEVLFSFIIVIEDKSVAKIDRTSFY